MLRTIILVCAWAFLALALWVVVQDPAGWPMLVGAAMLLAGTVYERYHYNGAANPAPSGRWEPTAERFLDERSGRPVTVWYNPDTGERRYVEAGDAPPTA